MGFISSPTLVVVAAVGTAAYTDSDVWAQGSHSQLVMSAGWMGAVVVYKGRRLPSLSSSCPILGSLWGLFIGRIGNDEILKCVKKILM